MQNRDPLLDYCLAALGNLGDAKQRPFSGLLSGITWQALWCKTDPLLWITVWHHLVIFMMQYRDPPLDYVWLHLASFVIQNRNPSLDYCLASLGKFCDAKQRPSSRLLSSNTWQALWCKTEILLWITVWHHLASFEMQNRDPPLDYCLASLGELCDAKQRPSSGLLSGSTWLCLWHKTEKLLWITVWHHLVSFVKHNRDPPLDYCLASLGNLCDAIQRPSSGLLSGILWQALWCKTETLLWITIWQHLASFVMQNRDTPLDYCLAILGKLCDAKQRASRGLLSGNSWQSL